MLNYKDFYKHILLQEYTDDNFNAPQPDLDTYGSPSTTQFKGTEIDKTGYNPLGIVTKKLAEISNLLEKNTPTSPDKWANAKSAARAKFKVYPSAYANLWAAKKYKSMGGGWKKGKQ